MATLSAREPHVPRFAIAEHALGSFPTVVLADRECATDARVALRGATVIGLGVPLNGRRHELADGYRDAAELETLQHARFAVMAPFANRIGGARYRFEGCEHDLQPGVEGPARAMRHGFVRDAAFELTVLHADDSAATATLSWHGLRPGTHPGWPFAVDLSVRYRLHATGLDITVSMRNVGDAAAPCFAGWHPYFRLGDGIGRCTLQVPARSLVRTDDAQVPLSGRAAYQPLEQAPAFDFRSPRALGDTVIDAAYADLCADADGRMRTRLRDPDSGLGLAVWQRRGVMLVFTGDTLRVRPRQSVALEPMECMADAFNRTDCAAAVRLESGARRDFDFGLEWDLP